LLAEDGGHFGEPDRGIAYRISGKTWVNNHAHVLRPTPDIDLAYLCRVLENYDVTPLVTGTTRGKLTKAGASEILIPLPPLPEQRRIAEVLDQAEALRAKRRAALSHFDSLTQSLFLDLFGDPATNPKHWPKVELGQVVKLVGGYAFKSEDFTAAGNAVVRISNLTGDGIDLTDIARIPDEKLGKGVGFKIQPGEILIAMSGATTGKLGVVPLELGEDLYQNQRVGNYRICDAERIQREYLLGLLRSTFYQRFLWQLAAGVAQPNVSGWQLESAAVPLPPVELQREFARRVTAVEKLKTAQRKSLAELDALFASLQHRAFRGEL
jgi:type I restriction enzyme S subunit